MTTINLYQKHKESDEESVLNKNGNSGFVFSLSLLIITFVAAIALEMYIPIAEKKNIALEKKVEVENMNLTGLKKLEDVTDTKRRLGLISENLEIKNGKAEKTEMSHVIDNMAADMSKGTFISQYSYSDGSIVAKLMANNFNEVARQILNFKRSENFVDVNVLRVARGEDNVEFDVKMKIKK